MLEHQSEVSQSLCGGKENDYIMHSLIILITYKASC